MESSGIKTMTVGDVELAYETFGDPSATPVLLVSGLGSQMISYADELCAGLAARGLFVIRFDNRDVGLSTHLHDAGLPRLGDVRRGDRSSVHYELADMAADTAGLVDALGLGSVHLVGVSMGGMIAQTLAIHHAERVLTLTSIMSTTGKRTVGWQNPRVIPALLASAGRTRRAKAWAGAQRTPGAAGCLSVARLIANSGSYGTIRLCPQVSVLCV